MVDVFGVLAAGARAVLVDRAESESRRAEQFGRFCAAVLEPEGGRVTLREPDRPPPADAVFDGQPTAFVLYTTGSTAAAKAVAQSHYSVVVNVLATARHHRMRSGEVMACALPVSHVNGLHFGVLATLFTGGTCLLFREFDPAGYLRALDTFGARRATTVPSLLRALLDVRRWPRLERLDYFVSAAATLPATTAAGIGDRSGHRVVQGYGLSECMNFATTMPPALPAETYQARVLEADIPPVGGALHGCEVAVRDAAGGVAGLRAVGEVVVRGHSVMSGYLGDDDATRQVMAGGWLRTGDLGRLDPGDGGEPWLTLVGRTKNIATCGGLSVSLDELDRWVTTLPGVVDACSVRRPDPRRVEAVTVFYVPAGDGVPDGAAVTGHLRDRWDAHALGLRVRAVPALPRLRSGKVDRRRLAGRAAQPPSREENEA